MSAWWVAVSSTGEPYSLGGALLVHDDRAELEFLIPDRRTQSVSGRCPEEVAARLGRPVMRLRDHPDMADVRWPLNREDFR